MVHASIDYTGSDGRRGTTSELLAIVTMCKTTGGDAARDLVWFKKFGSMRAFNLKTIQCLIGRFQVGRRWGIIDTSFGCDRTGFDDLDSDGEDDEDNDR